MRSVIVVVVSVLILGGVFFALQKKEGQSVKEGSKLELAQKDSPKKEVKAVSKPVAISGVKDSGKAEEVKIAKKPWSNEEEELELKRKWLKEFQDKVLEAIKLTQTTPEDKKAFEEFQTHLQSLWDKQSKEELKKLSLTEMESLKIPDEAVAKLKEELEREPSSD